MALTAPITHNYDHPSLTGVRSDGFHDLGGAATTVYGKKRFWHKSIVRAVYAFVNVADAASSTWQAYYRPAASPDGSADVALGSAWAVGTSAAGTTTTIALNGLTASGALAVDSQGHPVFNPGDAIILKTGSSNGADGRIDAGYEYQWSPGAGHN